MVRLIQQPTAGVDLLEQYRQSGSPDIFAQIMRAYGGMVLSVCYKVTKDAADAEDASQAVFLTLAVQCKTGNPIQYLGPWLKKVAKRTALDLVRSKKRRTRRETVTAENRPEHYTIRPGARPEADELNAILRAELDELPGKYRMPLVLHYFGGLSHDAISKEMKCTTAALGVRLHRARKMLGKRLTARGISLEGVALGAALAAAIPAVFTERFIHSTSAVVAGMNAAAYGFGQPVAMSGAMNGIGAAAALPDNFAAVLSLVHQVGNSMAKARMRMATLALAASITMLGGAAEATRFLPESLRPKLDFLAPSRLLKTLFEPTLHVPRLQAAPKSAPKRQTTPTDEPAAPAVFTAAAPLMASTNQPILAFQWAPPLPPPSSAAPVPLPRLTLSAAPPPRVVAMATLATTVAAQPEARPAVTLDTFHPGGGGGGSSAPAPAAETPSSSALGRPTANADHHDGPAIAPPPPPDPHRPSRPNQNLPAVPQTVASFEASAVGGATFDRVTPVDRDPFGRVPGPTQLAADASVPDSIRPTHGSVFVHGDGRYEWSDETVGITRGGVNSVDFTLSGVAGDGFVTIERLPVTTTEAPVRPTGHHFVGIWSINSTIDYEAIRVMPRYDEAFAESLGLPEDVLKLWVYDAGTWTRIMDSSFERDLVQHALSGKYEGQPQFFAVSAPEPAILGTLAVAGGLLLRRRRLPLPVSGSASEIP